MTESDRLMSRTERESCERYLVELRRASGRVPDEQVNWEAFHTRLLARADLSLARIRQPHGPVANVPLKSRSVPSRERLSTIPWWEHAARWSRLIVTGSIAAGIVLIMVVRASPKDASASDTVVASVVTSPEQMDRTRAAFESAAIGRGSPWSIESALLPSATDLLLPLGKGALSP